MPRYGAQSMVAPLRRVLVRAPGPAFAAADPREWHYTARPDGPAAEAEHRAFVALLEADGTEVLRAEEPAPSLADALFVHDPVLVTDRGALLLRMGKPRRRGEEDLLGAALERAGVPILGRLEAPAMAEGGDCLWLDHDTLAVGIGFRTSPDAVPQLERLLGPGVRIVLVQLPWYQGPEACLHLMSLVSLVDVNLAVVHSPLLPVVFRQELVRRGVELVEVPVEELASQATNVLAVAPRDCVMLEGNPVTGPAWRNAGAGCAATGGRRSRSRPRGGRPASPARSGGPEGSPQRVTACRTRIRSVMLSSVSTPTSAPPASTTGSAGRPLVRRRP